MKRILKLKKKYRELSSTNRLYSCPAPIIAITGGVASGKSSASKILSSVGPLICADALVKEIYQMESTIDFIEENIPSALKKDKIDFLKLRHLFYNDQSIKNKIESLIYPMLPELFNAHIKKLEACSFVFFDVPLLFEKELQKCVDVSVCVYASLNVQELRLAERDMQSKELTKKMLSSQMSIEEKKKISDYVINNNGTTVELNNNVKTFVSSHFE